MSNKYYIGFQSQNDSDENNLWLLKALPVGVGDGKNGEKHVCSPSSGSSRVALSLSGP